MYFFNFADSLNNKLLLESFYQLQNEVAETVKVRSKSERSNSTDIPQGDLSFSVLRLLFLKYAVDNCLGATTMAQMKVYLEVQKSIAAGNTEKFSDSIGSVLSIVEDWYHISPVLTNPSVIEAYQKDITVRDNNLTSRASELASPFEGIFRLLSSYDLTEDEHNPHAKGKQIYEAFRSSLKLSSDKNRFSGNLVSEDSVAELGKCILRVNEDDTFFDFAAGTGGSTITITGAQYPYVINFDSDPVACSINAMCLILYGYPNTKLRLRCCNIFDTTSKIEATKIFTDLPLRFDQTGEPLYSESQALSLSSCSGRTVPFKTMEAVKLAEDSLLPGGTAVLTVSPGFLIGSSDSLVEYRQHIVTEQLLKAVIHLDNSFLIVLSKNKAKDAFIRFLDLNAAAITSTEEFIQLYESKTDLESKIKRIPAASFHKVNGDSEAYRKYCLLPAAYLERVKADPVDINKLNAELEKNYAALKTLGQPSYPMPQFDQKLEELYQKLP